MTNSGRPHKTDAAIRARRDTGQRLLAQVEQALAALRRERTRITFAAVSRRAGVSRTFLYQHETARNLIAQAAGRAQETGRTARHQHAAEVEASWQQRALNNEDALREAHAEIGRQRTQIGKLLGRIRDLEHDLPEGSIARVLEENRLLRHDVHTLRQDNQALSERLEASRSNARFLDKKIADLQAQLAEHRVALLPK